jgi:ribonucleotide reductase alpha subunit
MSQMPQDQMHMQGIDPLQGKRFLVCKRDGRIEEFNEARILLAIESAFKAHHSVSSDGSLPESAQASVKHCAEKVVDRALGRALRGEQLEVELIQDMVENQLMLEGHLDVVRRYILYREQRRLARVQREGRERISAPIKEPAASSASAFDLASPLLKGIYRQALPRQKAGEKFEDVYRRHLDGCLNECEYWRFLTPDVLDFDSNRLARGLRLERDQPFSAAQLQLMREHYLLKDNDRCLETPQYFWMRVAMGLALHETEAQEERALEFYDAISSLRFIPSDLILRHAGTRNPRLIESADADSANSRIETWHRDIRNSFDGKKLWVPDLFMKRVRQQGSWCLFDPDEVSDLHDRFGNEFEKRFIACEQKAERGAMRFAKKVNAVDLWHEILTSLSGEGCVSFKDAVGIRSPRPDHEPIGGPGGAINLAAHISETDGQLDVQMLRGTIKTAVRMLDNALDLNTFPNEASRLNALEYRAVALGVAGFREALDRLHIPLESAGAAEFSDWSMELISHGAITASAELASERGPFPGYAESKWSQGILPLDTLGQLSQDRGVPVEVSSDTTQDWAAVREMIRRYGMRHDAVTAISPLGTPAMIAGVAPSLDHVLAEEDTDPRWLIECAARRQKWADMGQTLTLRASQKDLGKLADIYMYAWEKGITTIHQHCPEALADGRGRKRGHSGARHGLSSA